MTTEAGVYENLIHTNLRSHANSIPGTFPCSTDRCKACPHLCADTSISGPYGHMSIKRTFTCQSNYLVYAITCQSCNLIYVGETSKSLAVCFLEHLADIHHNHSKPVAQHFNSAGHTIADVKDIGLWQLHGDSFQRKHMESHIIQRLGTTSSKDWAPCPLVDWMNFFKLPVALLNYTLLLSRWNRSVCVHVCVRVCVFIIMWVDRALLIFVILMMLF